MRWRIKIYLYLGLFVLLMLPQVAWGASGWVSIDSPADGFTTTQGFTADITFTVTQDDTSCNTNGILDWAKLYVKLNDTTISWTTFFSCCGVSRFGEVQSHGPSISISGLDPSKMHTVTAYLQDMYYVPEQGCKYGAIFAQDSITFRICDGSSDPCCLPDADPCCWGGACCGSSDPCCGNPDPCCGSTDPCCNNCNCDDQCSCGGCGGGSSGGGAMNDYDFGNSGPSCMGGNP